MRLFSSFNEGFEPGVYACVKFCEETNTDLYLWGIKNYIPNVEQEGEYHSTILYSRAPCPGYVPENKLEQPIIVYGPFTPHIFPRKDSDKNVLVLEFKCQWMEDRHKLGRALGASHDFPEFRTHVTISYDAGDVDLSMLTEFKGPLKIVRENVEPLDTDFFERTGK